jgi:hypothetical protein
MVLTHNHIFIIITPRIPGSFNLMRWPVDMCSAKSTIEQSQYAHAFGPIRFFPSNPDPIGQSDQLAPRSGASNHCKGQSTD